MATKRASTAAPGTDPGAWTPEREAETLARVTGTVQLPAEVSGRLVNLGVGLVAPQRLDGYVTRGARARTLVGARLASDAGSASERSDGASAAQMQAALRAHADDLQRSPNPAMRAFSTFVPSV